MPLNQALFWTGVIITPLLWLVYFVRLKAATVGSLFSGRSTWHTRLLALLLGLLLAGIAIAAAEARIELGFTALLLLLYAFGLGDALRGLQPSGGNLPGQRPIFDELLQVILALLGIALAVFALLALVGWMLTNPIGQLLFVGLVMLGVVLLPAFSIAWHFNHLGRLLSRRQDSDEPKFP
jgi:hypothetical protein